MGLQAKNEDGVVVATPSFQLCISYDYQLRKEMGKRINQGASLKTALEATLKDTTPRERYFTTPCALQVRTSFSNPGKGNHWDPGSAQGGGRGRNRNDSGGDSGRGQSSKRQKKGPKGKGKAKGFIKGASHTPDGRQICFSFNADGCNTRGCTRVHCCRKCFGKHEMHNCPGGASPAPAAAAGGAPAAAAAASAPAGG